MTVLLAVAAALVLAGRGWMRRAAGSAAAAAPAAPAAAPAPDAPRETAPPRHLSGDARRLAEALLELNGSDAPFRVVDGSGGGRRPHRRVEARRRQVARPGHERRGQEGLPDLPQARLAAAHGPGRGPGLLRGLVGRRPDPGSPGARRGGRRGVLPGPAVLEGVRGRLPLRGPAGLPGEPAAGALGPPKPIYAYQFDTGRIKGPIQDTVARLGWTYKAVAFSAR